ncbi:hypothetical protein J437_LFUL010004 [Ladona fulva]|uniref:DM10 domain-containing protein n=1 Tax=Ladona fulva TaxID=123851 RepID=A0A8K0P1K8_LADFU|nr:hypothetical protein J437_LFUL010004 [Ladona fulva]
MYQNLLIIEIVDKFHLSQTTKFKNGYPLCTPVIHGIGKQPLDVDSVEFFQPVNPVRLDPEMTYGKKKQVMTFVLPQFYQYSNKTLTFHAYFKQSVLESPLEHDRVRQVKIHYFLEDDTITIIEPEVKNSGFTQGRLVRRNKIVKNDLGDTYTWKDFNIGIDICIYGIVYHIVNCDAYTKEYLSSQGIILGDPEEMPKDPYTERRKNVERQQLVTMPHPDDKLKRFLEYDGKVLRFNVVWDSRDQEFGEVRPYMLNYYLSDDTVEVREVRKTNDGRDPFPLLLRRQKLPKNWKDLPANFPSLVMEITEKEVSEFYTPSDLMVGNTICVLGRRFLIYDCDAFTRRYFQDVLRITQGQAISIEEKPPASPKRVRGRTCTFQILLDNLRNSKLYIFPRFNSGMNALNYHFFTYSQEIPPHIGIGAPEDSLQSCFNLQPQRPKPDFIKYLVNAGKVLRYTAKLDWVHPEDQDRRFVISYCLADGKVQIQELENRSTGIPGGRFLRAMLLPKHNTNPDDPEYYSPADFGIGCRVIAFGHHFIITGADLFVYRYMEENPDKFRPDIIEGVRNHLIETRVIKPDENE